MRLSTRILLSYSLILAVVGIALMFVVTRVTENIIYRASAQVLAGNAYRLADQLGQRNLLRRVYENSGELPWPGMLVLDRENRVVAIGRGLQALPFEVGQQVPALLAREAEAARRAGQPRGQVLRGQNLALGIVPVRSGAAATGWVVLVAQELRDLDGVVREIRRTVLLITVAGLLLATVAAGGIGQAMGRRLRQVQQAAAALAHGDLQRRAPEHGEDEAAELARSFNHMADRLEETIQGLHRSEQARRDLVAALAHELRTPVTSMRGFAEALRDGVVKDPEQAGRYLGIIAAESARLGRLVQDLFDFAKLDAGQLEFRMQRVELAPWLAEFAEGARARVEGAGLRFAPELAVPAGVMMTADLDRIAQVLHNLLDNAVRYAPEGTAVGLAAAVEGNRVRVSVQDQGPGVPPADQARIWDRFYRANGGGDSYAPTRGSSGAGLGLAIVKSIVTAHGGQVGLESRPGTGARFWFTLPLAE